MTTLLDLNRAVRDLLYSHVQVKDKILYAGSNIGSGDTTIVLSTQAQARQVGAGQVLELSNETGIESELVRVVAVDLGASTLTVRRAVMGTTAQAFTAATSMIRVEPEYPNHRLLAEINNVIVGLPPDIYAIRTHDADVDNWVDVGYTMPAGTVGVYSVKYLSIGPENAWHEVRQFRWDQETGLLNIFPVMDPGQPIKIVYRSYPTALAVAADTLVDDAGIPDTCAQLIQWGALYHLMLARAGGRLVDTRAEAPMNQEYRRADPVMAAVRGIFALYRERLDSERERQRLAYPPRPYYTF